MITKHSQNKNNTSLKSMKPNNVINKNKNNCDLFIEKLSLMPVTAIIFGQKDFSYGWLTVMKLKNYKAIP